MSTYKTYLSAPHLPLGSGRRLPFTPPQLAANGNGVTNGHSSYKGLPPSPRLPRQLPSTSRPNTAGSGDVPSFSMPLPEVNQPTSTDWSSPSDYSNGVVSRQPSARSVLRSTYGYDDLPPPRSPSSLDDMYASPDGHTSPPAPDSLRPGYRASEHALRAQPSQQALAPTPPSHYADSSCSYLSRITSQIPYLTLSCAR